MASSISNQELKREINKMKRRISALEKAFDSIATKDDVEAIEEAHEDMRQNRTMTLSEAKKRYSEIRG
jgi:predicted RNase H-like nuclease (RuvC/YqgF family)